MHITVITIHKKRGHCDITFKQLSYTAAVEWTKATSKVVSRWAKSVLLPCVSLFVPDSCKYFTSEMISHDVIFNQAYSNYLQRDRCRVLQRQLLPQGRICKWKDESQVIPHPSCFLRKTWAAWLEEGSQSNSQHVHTIHQTRRPCMLLPPAAVQSDTYGIYSYVKIDTALHKKLTPVKMFESFIHKNIEYVHGTQWKVVEYMYRIRM